MPLHVAQERHSPPACSDERHVPAARDALDHRRLEPRDIDFGHWLLKRTYCDRRSRNVEMLARVSDRTIAQAHFEDVPDFHGDFALLGELAPIAVELVFLIAGSDADYGTSTRLHVQQPDFLN